MPAILHPDFNGSNSVILPTPEFPLESPRQYSDIELPTGETTPLPVTTTRCLVFKSMFHIFCLANNNIINY